jgi:hypothetical protein
VMLDIESFRNHFQIVPKAGILFNYTLVTSWSEKSSYHKAARFHVSQGGAGCPSCAKTGYFPDEDGYLYFLRHSEWECSKLESRTMQKRELIDILQDGGKY